MKAKGATPLNPRLPPRRLVAREAGRPGPLRPQAWRTTDPKGESRRQGGHGGLEGGGGGDPGSFCTLRVRVFRLSRAAHTRLTHTPMVCIHCSYGCVEQIHPKPKKQTAMRVRPYFFLTYQKTARLHARLRNRGFTHIHNSPHTHRTGVVFTVFPQFVCPQENPAHHTVWVPHL